MFKKLQVFTAISLLLLGCTRVPLFNDEPQMPQFDMASLEKEIARQNELKKEKPPVVEMPKVEEKEIPQEEIAVEEPSVEPEEIVEEVKVPEKKIEKVNKKEKNIELSKIFKYSNVSYYAIDLKSGKVLANYRGDNVGVPASVMKIVTSGAALEVLGKDTRLETKLYYDGKINAKGVLNGDLYIQGGGDPTLGSDGFKGDREAFLTEWIGAVKKAGIKSVTGEIIVIDDLFGYEGVPGKWLLEDIATGFGQATYGISIFDNMTTLTLTSDAKKSKIVKVKPAVNKLTYQNQIKISPRGRKDIYVRGLPFENKRVLVGEIPKNTKTTEVKTDIPDPGLFLGEYFKTKLKASGVVVKGAVKTRRVSSKAAKNPHMLAVTKSKTVGEMLKVLLTRSDNHYTETLYQLLKLRNVDVEQFWKSKGIDTTGLLMYDGSGLSRADNMSAKMLVDILKYMNDNHPEFESMLARAGYEGTLYDFLQKERFDGVARVKSGSMSGIQSYAGYIEKGNKQIAFAIIVNQWSGNRKNLKLEMERMLKNLF